jgi:hypothetical protein
MMDDHYIICRARNGLSDALKALLKADIMTAEDFQESKNKAVIAIGALNELLRIKDGDAPKS